jgi:hypothetical protein
VLLVLHHDIINDDTVQKSQVHTTYLYFRAEFVGQGRRDAVTYKPLHHRDMEEH